MIKKTTKILLHYKIMKKQNKNKQDSRVQVLEMNNYTKPNPHSLLNQGNKFVTNGVNNEYFYYIESRYLGSPTNSAVIDGYANYIIGDGLEAVQGISQEDLESIISEEDLRMLATEFKMQGNAPVQVVYAQTPNKLVAKIYSLPAKTIAISNQTDISEDIERFWYSFDWQNRNKFKPYEIPAFGYGQERETEIYYIQRHSPQPLFALPDYQSGIQYCQVEEEMSNYYLNHIKNNFSAGKVVNIYQGESLDEEAELEAQRLIKSKFAGSNAAGTIIVAFNKNTEEKTTVENIEIVDAYQQFETLSKESREKIMLSHKVNNPALFGFANPTGFSSNGEELDQSLKMLYRSQINPMRRTIIKHLEEILKINNPEVKLRFKDFSDLKIN